MELSINNVTKQFKVKKAVDDISFSMKMVFMDCLESMVREKQR